MPRFCELCLYLEFKKLNSMHTRLERWEIKIDILCDTWYSTGKYLLNVAGRYWHNRFEFTCSNFNPKLLMLELDIFTCSKLTGNKWCESVLFPVRHWIHFTQHSIHLENVRPWKLKKSHLRIKHKVHSQSNHDCGCCYTSISVGWFFS